MRFGSVSFRCRRSQTSSADVTRKTRGFFRSFAFERLFSRLSSILFSGPGSHKAPSEVIKRFETHGFFSFSTARRVAQSPGSSQFHRFFVTTLAELLSPVMRRQCGDTRVYAGSPFAGHNRPIELVHKKSFLFFRMFSGFLSFGLSQIHCSILVFVRSCFPWTSRRQCGDILVSAGSPFVGHSVPFCGHVQTLPDFYICAPLHARKDSVFVEIFENFFS